MQPERFVTCGLVLRETVTRDADKILTVLTPDRGRLSVIARDSKPDLGGKAEDPAQGQPRGRGLPAAGLFGDDPL